MFLTSPTSFLGAWTALSLKSLGATVFGYGEASAESPNLFDIENLAQKISMTYADIRDEVALRQALDFAQADVVLHLGESGFLYESQRESPALFAKAVVGTSLLLEALKDTASVRSIVVTSSDKVYQRKGTEAFSEKAPVAAYEILPTARLCAELVALSYRHSFFNPDKYNKHKMALATARLGAAIGGGDFHPRSLIYEAVTSLESGQSLALRHPNSLRPWISVLDQVNGILLLAEKLIERGPKLAATYNLGANWVGTVQEFMQEVEQAWSPAALPGKEFLHEGGVSVHGSMDSELAQKDLGWSPQLELGPLVRDTVAWYKGYQQGLAGAGAEEQVRRFFENS